MKKLILGFLMFLAATPAYAGQGRVQDALTDTGSTIVVTNDVPVYGRAIRLESSSEYGVWFVATPSTSVANPCSSPLINGCGNNNLAIEMQLSYNGVDFAKPSDSFATLVNSQVASTPTVVLINSTIPMKYARFKVTNSAATYDTVMTMKLFSRDL